MVEFSILDFGFSIGKCNAQGFSYESMIPIISTAIYRGESMIPHDNRDPLLLAPRFILVN